MARCPFARWRPVKYVDRLDRMSDPPKAVFLHTNDGGADLTSWFDQLWDRNQERVGSTFQVYSDGSVDQLCETDRVIYAQYGASEWAVSIETEDDGDPDRPWTGQQIDTIVRLIQWLHDTHGVPLRLMSSSGARGISYHQQFPVYNKSGHNCPGPVRLNQLVHTVMPLLTGQPAHADDPSGSMAHVPAPMNTLPLPADTFSVDTQTWQRQMLRRGWSGLGDANGIYGDGSRKACLAFQREKGLQVTGVVDQATWAAAWTAPVTRPPAGTGHPTSPAAHPAAGDGAALTVTPNSQLLSDPRATRAQLESYMLGSPHGSYSDAQVRTIVATYDKTARTAGLDPLLVVAQMTHETGHLTSEWSQPPRRNPAGIGVTGEPGKGISFPDWKSAVRAHVGRLLAYALSKGTETETQKQLIDEALRWRPLPDSYRGVAPTLSALAGTWATDKQYATSIVRLANEIQNSS